MRLVDDYLFITTSVHKARLFLDVMNKGHPEYGCFIGKDKTLTNVDYDAQVMSLVDPSAKSEPLHVQRRICSEYNQQASHGAGISSICETWV